MGRQETRLNHTSKSIDEFLRWARTADYGEFCVYHEGSLGRDRVGNRDLSQVADTVLLLQDTGFVIATQFRSGIDMPTKYVATRTGYGYAPRAIIRGEITATDWRILCAVREARHGKSITRVIRDTLSTSSDAAAAGVLHTIKKAGWIEEDPSVMGWKISAAGLSLLV